MTRPACMKYHFEVPQPIDSIALRLAEAGFKVFLVGGAVRDLFLGRVPRDADLVVDRPLEQVRPSLPEAIQIPARTPLLVLPDVDPGVRIEISRRRGDMLTDLGTRDFTINAIALDPCRKRLIDPLGGLGDLETHTLRACDPATVFCADPIRILRGLRLALELELEIEPVTREAMDRESWRLQHSPGERLREELLRLLVLPQPSRGLRQWQEFGALAAVLPELVRGIGVLQNRHHREDVYDHSLTVCDQVPARPILRLAALLHDVAKPAVREWSPKTRDFTFHRHDLRATPMIGKIALRLRLSRREADRLERLIRHHLLFIDRLQSDAAIRRMIRRVGRDILCDLLELRRADLASRTRTLRAPEVWVQTEARIRDLEQDPERNLTPLAIGGKDIMQELGIPEGARVGHWLRRARRRALEHPEENERNTLRRWLREAYGQGDD